jgi:hypothetical protein
MSIEDYSKNIPTVQLHIITEISLPIRKRYAIGGTGGRAAFYKAILLDFARTAELVAFCDTNKTA